MKWVIDNRHKISVVVFVGMLLAIISVILAMSAAWGSRFNWWQFGMGFAMLKWGVYIGIAAALLSLLGLFAGGLGGGYRMLLKSVTGLGISLPVIIIPMLWLNMAKSVPPIHDISTDLEHPPLFEAIVQLRANAPNSLEYGGESVANQQREAYPYIQPVLTNTPPEEVFKIALQTVRELGWDIVAQDPQLGRIEAVDTTFWFGFKDDVVIRIAARDGDSGSQVDIRSVSRVGRSDVGTNAKRIREFIQSLQKYIQ